MSFEKNAPRQADFSPPHSQRRAVFVVEGPESISAEENGHTVGHNGPHFRENVLVRRLSRCGICRRLSGRWILISLQPVLFIPFPQSRSEGAFHDVHAAQEYGRRQDGVGVLLEGWILEVVIVERDEHRQGHECNAQQDTELLRLGPGKGCVDHEACCIYHGQFIDELHRICRAVHASRSVLSSGQGQKGEGWVFVACMWEPYT